MSLLDGIRHRLYVLWRGERYANEVEREIRFHLDLDGLARSAGGRSTTDVEIEARHTFGNATYYREEVRRMTPLQSVDRIRQDVAYAWRGLRRNPGFAVTVVLTLGLGLGVNAAMYSFLDQMLVRPPAGVVAPGGVRRLYVDSPRSRRAFGGAGIFPSLDYPLFDVVRKRAPHPDQVAAFTPTDGGVITGNGASDSTRVSYVTPEFFRVLRLRPALGRFFAPEEGSVETKTPVAVIGDELWQRAFGRDSAIIGRAIQIDGSQYIVIGVTPPDFSGIDLNLAEVWLPVNCFPLPPRNGRPWYTESGNYLKAIARIDAPADEAKLVGAGNTAARHDLTDPNRDTALSILTGPIIEARGPAPQSSEASLSTRLAGVALIVLLIASANVTSFLRLRGASRRRELAVRRALGVSRARLYGQLATESVLLGMLSCGCALLFALWAGAALRRLLTPTIHWASPAVGARIVLATGVLAVAIGIVAGLVPAIGVMREDLSSALKAGARQHSHRRAPSQAALLVTQAALSVVLLVGAGLFVRSLVNVLSIDLGYDRRGLLVTNLYVNDEKREQSIAQQLATIADRVRALPGVSNAGLSDHRPMGGYSIDPMFLPGHDSVALVAGQPPAEIVVSPGFFKASGVRMIAGRDFAASDVSGGAPVAIVDQQVAAAFWPSESPLGKCIVRGKKTSGCTTVIGIVHDVHRTRMIEEPMPQLYLPLTQHPDVLPGSIIVRVDGSQTSATVSALRAELGRLMPNHSEFSVRTMDEALDRELRPRRMGAILFSALGLLALVVAAIGIYGVVAFSVSQRTHEMGVRLALGAQARDILRLVLGEGLRLVAIGLVIGASAALLLGRLVASLLFGVAPSDPAVLIGATAMMLAIAIVASLIPGWRSARIDPVGTLRTD